jgi:hypothetical protein
MATNFPYTTLVLGRVDRASGNRIAREVKRNLEALRDADRKRGGCPPKAIVWTKAEDLEGEPVVAVLAQCTQAEGDWLEQVLIETV